MGGGISNFERLKRRRQEVRFFVQVSDYSIHVPFFLCSYR